MLEWYAIAASEYKLLKEQSVSDVEGTTVGNILLASMLLPAAVWLRNALLAGRAARPWWAWPLEMLLLPAAAALTVTSPWCVAAAAGTDPRVGGGCAAGAGAAAQLLPALLALALTATLWRGGSGGGGCDERSDGRDGDGALFPTPEARPHNDSGHGCEFL